MLRHILINNYFIIKAISNEKSNVQKLEQPVIFKFRNWSKGAMFKRSSVTPRVVPARSGHQFIYIPTRRVRALVTCVRCTPLLYRLLLKI